jgi:hypothetical protein
MPLDACAKGWRIVVNRGLDGYVEVPPFAGLRLRMGGASSARRVESGELDGSVSELVGSERRYRQGLDVSARCRRQPRVSENVFVVEPDR